MDKQLAYRMQLFAQVVRSGSLTSAAQALGQTKSGLSQNITALEESQGVQLIHRTTRSLALTDSGEIFYQRCCELEELLNQTCDEIQNHQQQLTGRITVTAPQALVDCLLVPVVAEVQGQFPELEFRLLVEDKQLDMLAHHIDLAIRVGKMADSQLKARKIGAFNELIYRPKDSKPEALVTMVLPWQASEAGRKEISVNNLSAAARFVVCGAAQAELPDIYMKALATDFETEVVTGQQRKITPIYAVHPFHNNAPRRVQYLIERLENQLQQLTHCE